MKINVREWLAMPIEQRLAAISNAMNKKHAFKK